MSRGSRRDWRHALGAAGSALLVLLLAACATPQVSQLEAQFPLDAQASLRGVPARADIGNVPFFAQTQYQCGPAALAMLARHAGRPTTPDDLTAQVYVPGRQGSFQVEMLAAARRQGLLAYPLRPQLQDVLREVAAGHPVLVFQNLSLPVYPLWHYAVVIGYDRARNTLVLHSGETERLEMSLFTFERTWARGGYWSMVALPPSQLPASAQPESFTAAAAALERVQPQAAQAAYGAALKAWPDQRAAWLGWGNTAYALGHKAQAAERFEAAVRQHAEFADAWNNLAQVRMELGQWKAAREAAVRAVALGGPRLAAYQTLRAQIDAQVDAHKAR